MATPSDPFRRLPPVAVAALLAFALGGPVHAASPEGTNEAATPDADLVAAEPDTAGASGESDEGPVAGTSADTGSTNEATTETATDDFPTVAIADYVLGCMAANGNSYEALQQCSCSIDFIKARMDYKSYEQAGTVMQVQRDVGQRGIFYRDSNWAKSRVERLEALQAESTLRCF